METFDDMLGICAQGVWLMVRARPCARGRTQPRIVPIADGRRAVEIPVTAAPQDGKANRALHDALAESLGVRKADLSLAAGATGRIKKWIIAGDAVRLRAHLCAWLGGL